MFAELSRGWYVVIAVGLAVAGYELYRHWDAAKRLLSRSVDSAHKTIARLLKRIGQSIRSGTVQADNAIADVMARIRNAPRLSPASGGPARGVSSPRAIEHAATATRLAPMLHAVRRATAAAALAAPLMLASAPAGALAPPSALVSQTASLAAAPSERRPARAPIVVNYAPNVIIHSADAGDTATLERRVMDVLERHGRELHQTLARELIRQQRTEF